MHNNDKRILSAEEQKLSEKELDIKDREADNKSNELEIMLENVSADAENPGEAT